MSQKGETEINTKKTNPKEKKQQLTHARAAQMPSSHNTLFACLQLHIILKYRTEKKEKWKRTNKAHTKHRPCIKELHVQQAKQKKNLLRTRAHTQSGHQAATAHYVYL